ncbi:Spherulation-specific family 4 [Neofusicoccum parvum]|uniref:Spherulation-specific family 4 n=1 Tax=Neofusicoccum parvum TaxID=310453 RepID=A0ACB5RZE2_9PEZI|nr:Spherulation-specific family 4 [Neofusicoccum parvum]
MFSRALFLLALSSQLLSRTVEAVGANALVPAYIYPLSATTWQPLYDQIAAHPNIKFNVIINPGSGPGADALPGADYEREVKKLKTYTNTRLVGYVAVNYTNKDISLVQGEIAKYAGYFLHPHLLQSRPSFPALPPCRSYRMQILINPLYFSWKSASSDTVSVDGIFFDEAPSDNVPAHISYLKSATAYARSFANTGFPAAPYVVTNPGISPANRTYLLPPNQPDLSLVYEEWYSNWTTNTGAKRQQIWDLDVDDSMLAVMLHDVPTALTCTQINDLVDDLKDNVGVQTLWLTEDHDYQVWPAAALWEKYSKSFEDGGSAC